MAYSFAACVLPQESARPRPMAMRRERHREHGLPAPCSSDLSSRGCVATTVACAVGTSLPSLPLSQSQNPSYPLVIYPSYGLVSVERAKDPLRFSASQVAASLFPPTQLSSAGDLETFCCCLMCFHLGHNLSHSSLLSKSWLVSVAVRVFHL
jgi:hypothetical protein